MTLYGFFRSGTSHRLRIALNLKGLTYDQVAVDLRTEQHLGAAYEAINPQQLVPVREIDGAVLTQSPAVLEWPEARCPSPALLPVDPMERAQVRAMTAIVGCDLSNVIGRPVAMDAGLAGSWPGFSPASSAGKAHRGASDRPDALRLPGAGLRRGARGRPGLPCASWALSIRDRVD